jgi:hypothetical protein
MSDTYYKDNEVRFVLSDCIATGTDYDEILHTSIEIHLGNIEHPIIEAETLQEAIKQFDRWCANYRVGSKVI